jgi:hypothetical protein
MLAIDSLVIDLIFKKDAMPAPEELIEAFGGEEAISSMKILDPDMQDPRFEMEISPSVPFRRRGERRLMIVDDSVAPMREDPRADPLVPLDLRPQKVKLLTVCKTGTVRLGRIFALGSWGDAVLVAETAQDLRAIALLAWALDPTIDVDGKKRANRLSQEEFENKLLAYEKRLEELDEKAILANLGSAKFERRDDLLVVDVLEPDGTWDQRRSFELEMNLAAVDQFSIIPGAPSAGKPNKGATQPKTTAAAKEQAEPAKAEPAVVEPPKPIGPPLVVAEIDSGLMLIFPPERFDLDVAASIGKSDWESVISSQDKLEGADRDRVHRDGAGFIAPLEFLSEVFIDGKPLSRAQFDETCQKLQDGTRTLEVHFPRFGPVLLLDVPKRGRFVSSNMRHPEAVVDLLPSG